MSAWRWRFGFLVIFGVLGFAAIAWGDSVNAAFGLTLGLAFTLEAAAVVMTVAGPTVVALTEGMAASIAVGGGIGAVNLAAVGLVAGVMGIVGIALVGGLVAFVVVPAIVAASRAGAGASGEMTDAMAAANAAVNAEANAAANLAAAIASFPPMALPLPTVRFSVTPTGELTITNVDGIDTGPGATPNTATACCPGFTTNQQIELSPAITVTPGSSDLPGIGESVPGSEPDASLDAAVNASAEAGEYGWIDGICRHYATGLSCAEYREHEREEYAHAAIVWPATGWLTLLVSLGLAGRWVSRRLA